MKSSYEQIATAAAKRWRKGYSITDGELYAMAYCDRSLMSDKDRDLVTECFYEVTDLHGEEISTYDEDYPNNTYYSGYRVGPHDYYTCYSGVAGNHWREECDSIAMW